MDYSKQDLYNIIKKLENDVDNTEENVNTQIEELSISTDSCDGCQCGDAVTLAQCFECSK